MQKQAVFITFFILINSVAFGQVKSKKQQRSSAPSYNLQIEHDIDSASYYINIDYNKSFNFIEKGFKKIGQNNNQDKDKLARLNELLGDIYINLEQFDLAKEKYTLAKNLYSVSKIDLIFKLINVSFKINDYNSANNLIQTLSIESNSETTQLEIYKFRGDILFKTNKLNEALTEYNKGLELAKKIKNNKYNILFDNRIAEVYSTRGSFDKAEMHLSNSISNVATADYNTQIKQAETNARIYRKNNKLDKEVKIRKKNIEVLEKLDINVKVLKELQHQNLSIAEAFIKNKKYKSAIPYLKNSIAINDKTVDLDIEIQATKKLSEAYENTGESQLALINYRNYVNLMDEKYKEKEKEINDAINLTKDLSDKQKRIDVLELDRELNESKEQIYQKDKNISKLNTKKQQLIIYSLLGGLLLAMIAIFYFYKNNKQRKIANNLLSLKALKSQMNPHFIFNALNSVNNYIALNDERQANKYLTDFSMLMRMVLDVSDKDFITLAEEVKLISLYLKLEHQRFQEKFDYTINIDKTLQLDKINIPPMLIQPFIENAVWHGLRYKENKGKLEISIHKNDNKDVNITIIDNGVGREKSKQLKSKNQLKKKSKGMFNTAERIKIINEMYNYNISLEINDLNLDKTGTKINLILPISG